MNQTYKCQHCKQHKPADQFYKVRDPSNYASQRASPYCIGCNTEAAAINKYKSEAKHDPKAFARKMESKEKQLQLMVRAAREISV